MNGTLRADAIVFAKTVPTIKPPNKPGPAVAAMAFKSVNLTFASLRASEVILSIISEWALAANSGTTPPKLLCTLSWLRTMLDKIFTLPSVLFSTTDTDVSSQLVSIPNTLTFSISSK